MIRTLKTLAAISLAAAAPAFAADTFVIDKGHSEVGFQVTHLGISKVRGRFRDFAGTIQVDPAKPESATVDLTIQVASIDTDNESRDKDLRSAEGFFDVAKFPTLAFKSSKVVARAKDRYEVTGTLTMHGVSKEVTLPVTVLGPVKDPWGNQKAGFETSITLNRKDYGLTYSKLMDNGGFVVSDEVAVSISLEAKKEAPAAK
jgi:polyisoprenoid-binding protein YceI